jgi:hypothetical protein
MISIPKKSIIGGVLFTLSWFFIIDINEYPYEPPLVRAFTRPPKMLIVFNPAAYHQY